MVIITVNGTLDGGIPMPHFKFKKLSCRLSFGEKHVSYVAFDK